MLLLLIVFYSCSSGDKKKKKEWSGSEAKARELFANKYIPELADDLKEISGLLMYDDLFWGFNDSGGKAKIYGFDSRGTIVKEIEIANADNHDWESIAQDQQFFYVGDFGNNNGNRKNLQILKIPKSAIGEANEQHVDAEIIQFNYARQTQFGYPHLSTPFDCEALMEHNNALYIFSKNWAEQTTSSYKIPKESGSHTVTAIDTFNVGGMITGADLSSDKSTLALLGYVNYHAFIWLFTNFEGDDFFGGNSQLIRLPNLDDAQTEGICFAGNDTLLISCENAKQFSQQVFVVDLKNTDHGAFQNK